MRLLLVEDERDLADTLASGLRREGYAVDVAYDGLSALTRLAAADADLVILDRDLPMLSGDAVCKTMRELQHPARILMLTAAGSLEDRVAGLDLGADDYLPKPFAYVELLARLRALARRTPRSPGIVLEAAGVRVDTVRRLAERDGRPLHLTPKELGVLETLLAARGGFVSVDELLAEIWPDSDERGRNVVKTAVHTLRGKLGAPDAIASAPGHGYRIEVGS
ncbi:response regulator transcription factor [Georgenia yuyongxinii]|uniref:Response regulator transcription factor n=1 Tax=Georgenia yuyongxinii TaxID=2589797 RepID=A0A552WNR8_9MICO|nr:response regulator transcription factor [Georgenia yuyongxinii]TRW44400.1 response regulator transcription factor [Georgenia yuyongxinii]